MRTRVEFDEYLKNIIDGDANVYFQPPSNVTGAGTKVIKNMKYPAVIYSVDDYNIRSADNRNYSISKEYSVEVVTKDPDSALVDKIVEIPTARFNRSYLSDGLYHSVFVIIF